MCVPRSVSWTLAIALGFLFLAEVVFMGAHSLPSASPDGDRFPLYIASDGLVWGALVGALSMVLRVVGFGLMVGAVARRPLPISPPLALGSLCGLSMAIFLLIGFDLAYARFDSMVPILEERWILQVRGESGSSPWNILPAWLIYADVFDQAGRNLLVCTLLFGLAAGTLRLSTVVATAIVTAAVGFPIVVAWVYGEAGILNLVPSDTEMAFAIHVLAGSAGAALLLASRLLPPRSPRDTLQATDDDFVRPSEWPPLTARRGAMLATGMVLFFVTLLNLGGLAGLSPNDWGPAIIVTSPTLALLGGGAAALLTAVMIRRRSLLHCAAVGTLAGWAIVAGGAENLETIPRLALGAVAGTLSCTLLHLLDRLKVDDPFGLLPAHLVCGSLGALVPGLPLATNDRWIAGDLLDQAGTVLVVTALGLTIGGVIALVGWLTGTLWKPADR